MRSLRTRRGPLPFLAIFFMIVGGCIPLDEGDLPTDPEYADLDLDGFSPTDGDCDDSDAAIHPDADEICNDIDDDCDDEADEGFDQDNDGVSSCVYINAPVDCDDDDAMRYPGLDEICDGVDNDCNQLSDDGLDADKDGYSSCANVNNPPDCNDGDDNIHPFANPLCDGIDNDCDGDADEGFDNDKDGFASCPLGQQAADCDDDEAQAYPGKNESCDALDNDCDGDIDEGFDGDGDGYKTCASRDSDLFPIPADCNDGDDDIHPGADEICNGFDDDCDEAVDDADDDIQDQGQWYVDGDLDGFGDPATEVISCVAPDDTIDVGGDCDDSDAESFPGAIWYLDEDGDGYGVDDDAIEVCERPGDGHVKVAGDCDDNAPETYEDAPEICDLEDNDCDEAVDENLANDDDGDGHIYCTESGEIIDCLDSNDTVYPGADEICDGLDNNCDETVDEGFDADEDGYTSCGVEGERLADCDDNDPLINPGVEDLCDGVDKDCDLEIDEGADVDGDGFNTCDSNSDQFDCDDDNAEIHPNTVWYHDADFDGYGEDQGAMVQCEAPGDDYAIQGDDCDEADPAVNPGAPEICNGGDDDCDSAVDENLDVDGDGDGHLGCDGGVSIDCDDFDAERYPGATEICNGVDDDCSGGTGDLFVTQNAVAEGSRYATIQGAVSAASDGCVIAVDKGIYREVVSLDGKLLTLRSEYGPSETLIVGVDGDLGSTLIAEGQTPTGTEVVGFTLIGDNGSQPDDELTIFGGAVYVGDRSSLILRENIIQDSTADLGAAVACRGCRKLTLLGNSFNGNYAYRYQEGLFWKLGYGGAVYVSDGELESVANRFEDNEAGLYGGAVYLENSEWHSNGDLILENIAVAGGGVYATESQTYIDQLTCRENLALALFDGVDFRAGEGGGLALRSNSYAEISTSDISYNTGGSAEAIGYGGGIRVRESQLLLTQSVVGYNRAVDSTGGGVDAELSHISLKNNLFVHNFADFHGTALFLDACPPFEIINNTVVESQNEGDGVAALSIWGSTGQLYNNIISHTAGGYGFQFSAESLIHDDVVVPVNPEIVQYNDFFSNELGNVTGEMGVNTGELGNLLVDPLYTDAGASDYSLTESSPLIDGGHGDDIFLDVDGSRNDIGMTGGPGGDWSTQDVGSTLLQ